MHLFFTKLFFALCLIVAGSTAFAQVKFVATVSPENPGKDDYITLRLTAENAHSIETINLPSLNDFSLVSGPNRESGMSSINGRIKEYLAVSYVLKPKHKGRISIGCATASVAGKKYKSNPLFLTVSNNGGSASQGSAPMPAVPFFEEPQPAADYRADILKQGESAEARIRNNMLLRLVTNKQSVYEGEPVLAEYRLYTRLKSESSLTKNPSFNGFSVVEIPPDEASNGGREKYNGSEYNVYCIRKAQLYPLQAGTAVLDAATLDNRVQMIRIPAGSRGFEGAEVITERAALSSKPITITVKPLPPGKPASFGGAVGEFKFYCEPAQLNITTDDIGKINLTIAGKGNMHLITAPAVNWPAVFEIFEPKITDNAINAVCPTSGKKIFELSFSVAATGTYNLPPVEFSYFNPASGNYTTLKSKAVVVNVVRGKLNKTANSKTAASAPMRENKNGNYYLIVAAAVLGLLLMGLLYFRKKSTSERISPVPVIQDEPIEEAVAVAQHNPLAKTEECLTTDECPEHWQVFSTELRQFFAHKFNVPEAAVNAKTLGGVLDRAGVDNSTILDAQQLFRAVEWQLYTPFQNEKKLSDLYAAAQSVIRFINMPRA